MSKSLIAAVAAAASLFAAGAAQAGNVYWSIGISAPPVGTVISNAPPVYAPPVYAPPVVYAPPPVIYAPPPVVYAPAPVVYAPPVYRPVPRVVYPAPVGYYRHGWHDRDRDGIPDRYDGWDNRWDRGERRHHH